MMTTKRDFSFFSSILKWALISVGSFIIILIILVMFLMVDKRFIFSYKARTSVHLAAILLEKNLFLNAVLIAESCLLVQNIVIS